MIFYFVYQLIKLLKVGNRRETWILPVGGPYLV